MKEQVAADPNKYRHLLSHLSTADKTIYVECFGKTIHRRLGGHEAEAAYKANAPESCRTEIRMLAGCSARATDIRVDATYLDGSRKYSGLQSDCGG